MNKGNFDSCEHDRQFHIDSGESGFPGDKPRQSFFLCQKCFNEITLQEKCSLDLVKQTKSSLVIQERQTRTGMRANIISAIILIIAFLTLLLGDKILK